MKFFTLSIALIFCNLGNLFSQNLDNLDINLDSLSAQIQQVTDTNLYKGYWQFMLGVSSKNLKENFIGEIKRIYL